MQLYILLRGNSKKRLKPVMIDQIHKVRNYRDDLITSGHDDWFDIKPAPKDAKPWRKNNSNQWTNYDSSNPPLVKNGSRG